jgi:hypothetical protein
VIFEAKPAAAWRNKTARYVVAANDRRIGSRTGKELGEAD